MGGGNEMDSSGWHPNSEKDWAGEISLQGGGDTPGLGDPWKWPQLEPWSPGRGEGAALAPDEPFPPPLYPIQISNPPNAACVCWGGAGSAAHGHTPVLPV